MTTPAASPLVRRFEHLTEVGRALAREHDAARLLDIIVAAAIRLCNADGGALYRVNDAGDALVFAIVHNRTLRWGEGGARAADLALPVVPLTGPMANRITTRWSRSAHTRRVCASAMSTVAGLISPPPSDSTRSTATIRARSSPCRCKIIATN
jgi:hypothetical protein